MRLSLHRRGALLALLGAAGLVNIGDAAETGPPLRIGHYSSVNGLAGFVLDRLGTPIKLRLDGSEEIWALAVVPAPLNAVSLKRDDGSYVLRIDDRGNITFFDATFFNGVKVVRDQDAQSLAIATATRSKAEDAAANLGKELTRLSGGNVTISLDAPVLAPDADAWSAIADAVAIVGISLKEVVADALGREAVAKKVKRILIRDSGQVAIKLVGQMLVVEIAADKPINGRPSSGLLTSTIGKLL